MDPSSSRDWLSCSRQMDPEEVRDVTIIDNDNDDNNDNIRGLVVVEREHMFDKVVTPSDVGKLNRLVIPKQHAEKYFPLDSTNSNSCGNNNGNNNNNNNNNESKAGLLLNFEDTTGKSWRFRYSYWNSSQSYVMTKGWSRFVKEKQLSAGDIVSFQRAVGDDVVSRNTFFIDWRRRPPDHHHHHLHHLGTAFSVHHSIPGWSSSGSGSGIIGGGGITTPTFFLRSHPLDPHPHTHPNALWDHSSYRNNNDYNTYNNSNVTHLSPPMNGNIMSMVPYAYGGGSRTGATSVVNPTSGSLILLRSPVPNSGSLNYHHLMPPSSSSGDNGPLNKVYDSVPVVHGKAPLPPSSGSGAGKRSLRLFGVNMEYDHVPVNGQSSYSPPPSNTSSTSNYEGSEN